jgi:hypothetical protein
MIQITKINGNTLTKVQREQLNAIVEMDRGKAEGQLIE